MFWPWMSRICAGVVAGDMARMLVRVDEAGEVGSPELRADRVAETTGDGAREWRVDDDDALGRRNGHDGVAPRIAGENAFSMAAIARPGVAGRLRRPFVDPTGQCSKNGRRPRDSFPRLPPRRGHVVVRKPGMRAKDPDLTSAIARPLRAAPFTTTSKRRELCKET
jgi:hypothetical protein